MTDALYTINFAALGLREAVAATGNATLAAAEAKLAGYLARIQQRSSARPELDGAWMRAFDYEKWEVWASASDIGWGPWCVETGWMNSWIITSLSLHAQNRSVWAVTGGGAAANALRDELRSWKPWFFGSLKSDDSVVAPAPTQSMLSVKDLWMELSRSNNGAPKQALKSDDDENMAEHWRFGKPGLQAVIAGVRCNGDGGKPTPTHTCESLVSFHQGATWEHLAYASAVNGVATRIDATTGDHLGNCCFKRSAANQTYPPGPYGDKDCTFAMAFSWTGETVSEVGTANTVRQPETQD